MTTPYLTRDFPAVDETEDVGSFVRYLDAVTNLDAVRRYKLRTFELLGVHVGDRVLDLGKARTTPGLPVGEVGRWLGGSLLRLRSRPGHRGGVSSCRPGTSGPRRCSVVASGPLSNRACGSPAHGSPTSFTVRHAQSDSAPFR